MSIIKSKRRRPESLGYNSWLTIPFGGGSFSYGTGLTIGNSYTNPLGLNSKFTHLSYTVQGTSPGGISAVVNIRSGALTTAPATNTSYGYFDLGGTFAVGDTITVSISSVPYVPFTVSAREAGNNTALAANLTAALNRDPSFSALWVANSLGAEIVLQPLVYDAVTYTYSVAVHSTAGTATPGGAVMVAGTGTQAAYPALIQDQTQNGTVPSAVAPAGAALFPVDIIIPTFSSDATGRTGSIYATHNFDCIWGSNSSISLTLVNNGPISALDIVAQLYGVPVDNQPMLPQSSNGLFYPEPLIL